MNSKSGAGDGPVEARIIDIQMPFGSMVTFMVKWAIAAIPALIILFILGVVALNLLSVIGMRM